MSGQTLSRIITGHAAAFPDRTALTFLPDATADEGISLTYAELDRAARRIGSWLREHSAPGDRVLLLHHPGLEFAKALVGCLHSGAVAVPSPLPGTQAQHRRRVTGIVRDCGATVVLTDTASRPEVEQWLAEEGLSAVRCAATDGDALGDAHWQPADVGAQGLALIQYTSGSTSDPKGVMITQANLVHNARAIARTLGSSPATRFGGWLPHFHDLGLMGMLLQPLYHGGSSVFMAPLSFLKRPHDWLRMLDRHDIHMSGAPNFAYDLCVRRLTDRQIAGLDLSRWRVAVNGAEPIRAGTVADFTRRLAPAGLRAETMFPCYGMAEATLVVCGDRPDRPPVTRAVRTGPLERGQWVPAGPATPPGDARELVSSGSLSALDVVIVDPDSGQELAEGDVGEIWVRADNIAQGYWGRPAATAEVFGATTAAGRTGYLRTGDLGVARDGELYVTGRLKDVIILQGRNLHPHDIEMESRTVHPALKDGSAAAFCDDQQVVVIQEIRAGGLGPAELTAIARDASQHLGREFGLGGARVLLARPGTVRRTSSGKVQRSVMRELYTAGALETLTGAVPEGTAV